MCAAHVHGPRGPCACTTHAVPRSNWWRHVGEARSKGGHANSRRALGYLHLAIDYGAGGRRAPRPSGAPPSQLLPSENSARGVPPHNWYVREARCWLGRCARGSDNRGLRSADALRAAAQYHSMREELPTAMAKHATTKTAAGKHNNAGQRTGERGPRWSNHIL